MGSPEKTAQPIDLAEVSALVERIELDLARAKTGSADVQALRDEVEALRSALQQPGGPHEAHVNDRLTNIHRILDTAVDVVIDDAMRVADYVARIGRMLGM